MLHFIFKFIMQNSLMKIVERTNLRLGQIFTVMIHLLSKELKLPAEKNMVQDNDPSTFNITIKITYDR